MKRLLIARSNRSRAFIGFALAVAVFAFAGVGRAQVVSLDVLHTFTGGATDGSNPFAGLVQATDGNFYGTTVIGGVSNLGTVFKMTPAGTVSVLHSFAGGADGANPHYGALIQATDGNFYGTTFNGGVSGFGTVFKMTTAGIVTVLHAFAGGTDGATPQPGLIQATDGNFYGTTVSGGASNLGTVFKMTPAGTVSVSHAFAGSSAADGENPEAGLIQATDGNFYGTTVGGGASNLGTVFKMTPAGTVSVLHSFAGGTDGANPYFGALIQATDGNFYGTTVIGGAFSLGTVFKMTPAGTVSVLHSFIGSPTDGARPLAALIQATDGNFYGTTSEGGAFSPGLGTVFQMTPSGTVTVLHAFAGGTEGENPQAGLVEATDGNFYGTAGAGASNAGVVFRLDTHLCVDTLHLSYTAGTLNLGFTLQSSVPTTWSTWAIVSGGIANLWSVPIPAVSPAVSFNVPIPGVPPIGNVGILTALSTPTLGITCFDWKLVNTGP